MINEMRLTMKYSLYLQILLFGIIAFSCSNGPTNTKQNQINQNIALLKDCCNGEGITGYYLMGQMVKNKVFYAIRPVEEIKTDSSFKLVNANYLDYIPRDDAKPESFFQFNKDFSKLLIVKTTFIDISMGELDEANIKNETYSIVKDSTYRISSAVYWHGDDNKLVYYSYGNDRGLKAGYYLYNETTDQDSLLLAYESPDGPSEMINGFDLSPDNSKLLIPMVRATPLTARSPLVGIYNLHTQTMDTLKVHFDLSYVRVGLWLRYNSDGSKILYCNFPHGSYTYTTNDDSQVGIIEMPSQTKRVLDVNTYIGGRSVQLAPTWGPNDQNIIYGSAPLAMPSGAKGTYSLYVLKRVTDPDNYIQ